MRKALGDKPKERLANAGWMLKAVDAIRDIAVGTKAEVYQIGAESAINYFRLCSYLSIAKEVFCLPMATSFSDLSKSKVP